MVFPIKLQLILSIFRNLPQPSNVVYIQRQRTLYEDYMASSETRSKLTSGNFLGVANVLMQLRKVRGRTFLCTILLLFLLYQSKNDLEFFL